jgi:hypothetical protein
VVWTERGGPAVSTPTGSGGYGSKLINRAMLAQLHGIITCDWAVDGVVVTLKMNRTRVEQEGVFAVMHPILWTPTRRYTNVLYVGAAKVSLSGCLQHWRDWKSSPSDCSQLGDMTAIGTVKPFSTKA